MYPKGKDLEKIVWAKTRLTLREFAEALGYHWHAAYRWNKCGISKVAAAQADEHFDGLIQAHELRPDFFGDPNKYEVTPEMLAYAARMAKEWKAKMAEMEQQP